MYQSNRRFQPNRFGGNRPRTTGRGRPIRSFSDHSAFVKKATAQAVKPFVPVHAFSDFALHNQLQQNVTLRGYTAPTPIQDQAIPVIMEGKDIIGIAQTGTGKTAAFLLPLIHKVFLNRSEKVLIIVPTRELAVQIDDEFRAFAKNMNLYSVLVIGGMSMGQQIYSLRRNPNFVIGTPGRLKDLEQQGRIRFSEYKSIVLDEVDRMLDMGFIREIQYLVAKLPAERHSLFFSATVPVSIRGVMEQLLKNPVTISIQTQASSGHVNQDVVKLNGKPKVEVLHDLLISEGFDKVLLFGRTKWGIEKLLDELLKRGFRVAAIHGNKRQSQRQRALDEFKSNRIQVLLATDIASRGIDVSGVTHVINYDLPGSYEDYIHRIGRTGRADRFGTALTFVD